MPGRLAAPERSAKKDRMISHICGVKFFAKKKEKILDKEKINYRIETIPFWKEKCIFEMKGRYAGFKGWSAPIRTACNRG